MTNGFSETVLLEDEELTCEHCGRPIYGGETVFTRDEPDGTRTVLCGIDCLLEWVDANVQF